MARASRKLRKLRRIKRERTLAFRMLDVALKQRDMLRSYFSHLEAKRMEDDLNNVPKEGELVV